MCAGDREMVTAATLLSCCLEGIDKVMRYSAVRVRNSVQDQCAEQSQRQ